jgi:hypothetical protein
MVIISSSSRQAGLITCMREMKNEYKILVVKLKGRGLVVGGRIILE